MFLNLFAQAIHDQNKIELTFYSIEDGRILVRTCAPLDYGPSRRAADKSDRYHFWDYDSDKKNHVLSLRPEQIKDMVVLQDRFNPSEFITWSTSSHPWFFPRKWGAFS